MRLAFLSTQHEVAHLTWFVPVKSSKMKTNHNLKSKAGCVGGYITNPFAEKWEDEEMVLLT